jgi:hypothetical protein
MQLFNFHPSHFHNIRAEDVENDEKSCVRIESLESRCHCHQRALPRRDTRSQGLHPLGHHAHRPLPHRRKTRLYPPQPSRRVTHSIFKRPIQTASDPSGPADGRVSIFKMAGITPCGDWCEASRNISTESLTNQIDELPHPENPTRL